MTSMWSALSDRDYQEQGPRPASTRSEPILMCRCGARLTEGSAIGHLSMQTVCHQCAASEGAEYLRRRAGHPGSQSEVA